MALKARQVKPKFGWRQSTSPFSTWAKLRTIVGGGLSYLPARSRMSCVWVETLKSVMSTSEIRPSHTPASSHRHQGGCTGGEALRSDIAVVASGSAHGFHQAAAMDAANRRLLDACAALTLDTGEYWELVEKPAPHEWPVEALPSAEEPILEDAAAGNYEVLQLHPTDFASRTLARMDVDPEVRALIAGYYHAYSIEKTSPSLAAVTYVSIIESIGGKVEPLRKCECCEACEQRIGYARQFREALKLVLPKGEAKRLAVLYNKRSKTAHQGALHGEEFRVSGFLNTFDRDPSRYFLYTEVWHIRAAAAALLRLFVSDELPKPNLHTAPDAG